MSTAYFTAAIPGNFRREVLVNHDAYMASGHEVAIPSRLDFHPGVVSFGPYEDSMHGPAPDFRPEITFGRSKAYSPDLTQLLYILTVADDGGIPVNFSSASGNRADDGIPL